ncbi:MAG: inverse autotransporter beta domain-containing protein, partial [Pseudomonadota bacterium]
MSASSIETSERRICSIPSLLSTSSLTLAVVSATAGTALAGGKADKLVVNHDPEERGFARILRSISQAFQRVGEDEENTYYLGNRAAAPAKASPAPTTPAFAPTTSAPVLPTAAALSAEKRTKAAPEQTAVYASPVIITPASADAGSAIDAVKWHPHVDLIAKPGTDRMIGKADFFAPLMQDEDSMLFANMRGVFTSDPIQEGNFGLGYRQIVPQGFFGQDAIFGVYGFFDVRNSQNNNMFYQGTFGGEILTEMFEFRANAYLPNRKTHQVAGVGGGGVVLNGVTLTQGGGLVERALPGFDLEAGVKIPIFDKTSFRLNAAYFRFERGQTLVEGPRVRGEFIWDDVGGVQGAKISIGGEFRHDKVRGSDGYGFVRLRIPLYDVNGPSAPRRELVGIEREMTRFIHRDADILTPTVEDGAGGAGGQALTDQASGQELNVFEVAQAAQGAGDCTSGNACTVAQAFGGGALGGVTPGIGDIIFTVNDAGNINADINLNAARQQIVGDPTGAGTQVTLPDAAATQFTATNASGRATVAGMITLSQDNTVRGFDVNSPGNGLIGTGNIGTATISDMTIQGANGGATFNGNPMGTANFANDVTINNVGGNPALGVGGGSLNVNFSGNINNTGAGAAFSAQNGHTGTVTFDTGTINATNGTGLQFNDADGNYNFNGTATLNGGDAGIDILGNSAGTFTFGAGTAITNPTGIGLLVLGDGTNNPAITYNGTINNNADRAVTISSTAAGANQININGAITDSGTGIFFNAVAQNVNFAGSNALTGGGIDILGGTGTFTFTDTDITNPADTALEINGGSSNVNVGANSAFSQNGNQTVVDVNNGHSGNLNFMGTINATNGDGLQFDNADGTYDFNGAIALNGGDAGIDILNGSAGTFTFANTAITSPTGDAVNVNGSSANVNFGSSSSITQANNASAVQLTNHTGGTFQFDGTINATNGDGLQFDNADGIYNFTDQVTLNGGDAGIDILNGSDGVFTFTNTDITSPTGTAVDISGTTGNITFGADSSITQANNALAIDIENLISGILQFNGTVNATNGTGIELNNVDGTANFAGTVTLNGGDAGVDIINGSDGAITFADLDITSPTGVGLRIDASNGAFTFGAGSSITQANNASAVQITGPSTGTTNFNGTINAT